MTFGRLRARISDTFKYQPLLKPIAFAAFALILSGSLWLAAAGAINCVTIRHDGVQIQVNTVVGTVKDALEQSGVEIGNYDSVTPGLDERLTDNMHIVIQRAMTVNVYDADVLTTYHTVAKTVAQLLNEIGCTPNEYDEVSASLEDAVTNGMNLRIDRVVHETQQHTEEIAFETVYQNTSSLYKGVQQVSVAGSAGQRLITETVVYKNGAETDRYVVSDEVTSQPVDQVVMCGTKSVSYVVSASVVGASAGALDLSDGSQISYSQVISGTATAYTYTGHNTATGTAPGYGTVAVDPSVIPLGTRMYIPGYGYCVARDTGGAIKGTRIDLFFETYAQAIGWGRRSVTIYILN